MLNFKEYIWHMDSALKLAEEAYRNDEVPVAALIIDGNGKIISEAHNKKEKSHDVTGHAEIIAIKKAAQKLESWRLQECTLIVTLEPCPMCLHAVLQSRLSKVVFGAYDKKGGALSLGYNFHQDKRLNHNFSVIGGVNHHPCSEILSRFFKEKRSYYQSKF